MLDIVTIASLNFQNHKTDFQVILYVITKSFLMVESQRRFSMNP